MLNTILDGILLFSKGEVVLNGKTVLSNHKPGQVHPPNLIN